jgi:pyridoxal phosphate enzyme (YggS family)
VLRERIESVRQRIARSCARSGREPSSVMLVAVTKGVPVERIREAVALGLTELGENRVQEARAKQAALGVGLWAGGKSAVGPERLVPEPPRPAAQSLGRGGRVPSPQPVRWHLIGHLQRNKAKLAAALFDLIHSVDAPALAEELDRAARQVLRASARPLDVLVQVNVSGESTKFGVPPGAAGDLIRLITRCAALRFQGLMTIAPFSEDPEASRPCFRRLRELRDALAQAAGVPAAEFKLSMGMSQDFEVAIEEGADLVRVGTAIFGQDL